MFSTICRSGTTLLLGVLILLPSASLQAQKPDPQDPIGANARLGAARDAPNANREFLRIRGHLALSDRLIVKLANPNEKAKAAMTATALDNAGLQVEKEFRNVPGLRRLRIKGGKAAKAMNEDSLERTIKELRQTGLFEYVEPDWQVHALQLPADSGFTNGSLWGLRNTGQSGGTSGIDVDAVNAWPITTGSASVIVGVVDSGVRYTHQDLAANMWTNPTEIAGNGIDDDGNGYIDDVYGINAITNSGNPMDDNDHGSHCAGTIAAGAFNAGQHVGVAYNCRIMALKFLDANGSGNTSNAIECIDYAVANGAKILNNSWGGGGFSQALADSIQAAHDAGVLFVAAAGNSGTDNDLIPQYPSNYDIPNVVSVAAIDRTGALASFSCFGPVTVDVGAPGVAILSCTADSDTSYALFNGTSMATPHVAGVAALLASRFPGISVAELKNRLVRAAAPLASLNGKVASGGRVDAHAALTATEDGIMELSALSNGSVSPNSAHRFFVSVSDLAPVTGATVTGSLNGAPSTTFRDNGLAPDQTANDAIYTAELSVPNGVTSVNLLINASAAGKAPASQTFSFPVVPRPQNDDFAGRIVLSPSSNQTTGTNVNATFQTGEPRNPTVAGTRTVWWEWRAPTNGSTTFTTQGSNYDTTLAIYTGSALTSLNLVGSNDDAIGLQSSVSFVATAGTAYQIQVNGYSSSQGNIVLNYVAPNGGGGADYTITTRDRGSYKSDGSHDPVNDGYLTGQNNVAPISEFRSFFVFDIPVIGANEAIVSAELRLFNPLNGYTSSDATETLLMKEVTTAISSLTGGTGGTAAFNDLGDGVSYSSPVTVSSASNGVTLSIPLNDAFLSRVRSATGSSIAVGGALTTLSPTSIGGVFALSGAEDTDTQLLLTTAPRPANNHFASRIPIPSGVTQVTGTNALADVEPGEPSPLGAQKTVWWSWTAPSTGLAQITTTGSTFDTKLVVYTGTALASLTVVASNDNGDGQQSVVHFATIAGMVYQIQVDGAAGAEGNIVLNVPSAGGGAGTITLNALDRGWYDNTGFHSPTNGNYITGYNTAGSEKRSFFVFAVPTLSSGQVITSAQLRLYNPSSGYGGRDPFETLQIREVLTPAASIISGAGGVPAFTDLGDGTVFGSRTVSAADNGTVIAVPLNDASLNALNASAGSSAVLGGSIFPLTPAVGEHVFANTSSLSTDVQLVLDLSDGGGTSSNSLLSTPTAATPMTFSNETQGTRFETGGSYLTVASLGFYDNEEDGLTNAHEVTLFHYDTGTTVASVTVPAGTAAPLREKTRWVPLPSPVTLELNTQYVIATQHFSSPDDVFLNGSSTQVIRYSGVTLLHAVFAPGTSLPLAMPRSRDGGDFTLGANVEFGPRTAEISVESEGAELPDGASTLNFGLVQLGSNSTRFLTIRNVGTAPLNGLSLAFSGVHRTEFAAPPIGATLLPGTSLAAAIHFSAANLGSRSAELIISSSDADENPYNIALAAIVAVPILNVSGNGTPISNGDSTPTPADHTDFGHSTIAGGLLQRTFTIHNSGEGLLTLGTIQASGPGSADFLVATPPASPVAPGANTTFQIAFAPSAVGLRHATLTFTSNDPDQSPFSFAISGSGVTPEIAVDHPPAQPDLVDGASTVQFGAVNTGTPSPPKTFIVRNLGTSDLHLGAIEVSGGRSSDFAVDTTGLVSLLPPGANTSFQVGFTPSAAGARSTTLRIASDDVDESSFDVVLTGSGNTRPVVNLTGVTPLVFEAAAVYNDPGATASDAEDGQLLPSITASTVIPNALGTYMLTWSVTDSGGLTGLATRVVRVVDRLPPQITPPANMEIAASSKEGTVVHYPPAVITDAVGIASITYHPVSGSTMPIGHNTVSITATDTQGNSSTKSFQVKVTPLPQIDRLPPVIRITEPRGTTVAGPFTIAGTVRENFALASLSVRLNGMPIPLNTTENDLNVNNASMPWTAPGAEPENGPNLIEVTAVDLAGHQARTAKRFTYANPALAPLAGSYEALISPEGTGSAGIDTVGSLSLALNDRGSFSGSVRIGGTKLPLRGVLRNNGEARFLNVLSDTLQLTAGTRGALRSVGILNLNVTATGLSGALKDASEQVTASFAAVKASYSAQNPVPAAFLNLPDNGTYNLVFPASAQNPPLPRESYPQGDGVAHLSLHRTGLIRLAGHLADGTRITAAFRFRADNSAPLFAQLYALRRGGFAGELRFANLRESDTSGLGFTWLRPQQPNVRSYQAGWPEGLSINALGTFYSRSASLDFGQGPDDLVSGNTILTLEDGKLLPSVNHPLNVNRQTAKVTRVPATNPSYSLVLLPANGALSGTFTHQNGTKSAFRGILLNKPSSTHRGAYGYFLTNDRLNGESGGLSLAP